MSPVTVHVHRPLTKRPSSPPRPTGCFPRARPIFVGLSLRIALARPSGWQPSEITSRVAPEPESKLTLFRLPHFTASSPLLCNGVLSPKRIHLAELRSVLVLHTRNEPIRSCHGPQDGLQRKCFSGFPVAEDVSRRKPQSTPNPTLRTHPILTRLFDQLFDLAAPFYLPLPLLEDPPYTSSRPWWMLGKHTTSFPTILDHAPLLLPRRSSFIGHNPVGIVAIPA
ncbi:hypothetical protein C8F01DRAFT_1339622 [Mycena amicta]|nr:hypothetical protein C8F01DRAFT_1339622 [Mycena amicta]